MIVFLCEVDSLFKLGLTVFLLFKNNLFHEPHQIQDKNKLYLS